jgi:hypothetical protein
MVLTSLTLAMLNVGKIRKSLTNGLHSLGIQNSRLGRAFPFSGNPEELLSPTFVVPVLALVEVDEYRILTHSQFDGPVLGRWTVYTEELGGIHFSSEDLPPQDR